MKILQVAPYFLPYMGGQEIYIYNLSKHLVAMGHEVHIITSNYPKSKYYEEIDGITVERNDVEFRPLRNPISKGFFNIKELANDFDIIQTHNLFAFSSWMASYYKKKFDYPLILTDHGKLKFGLWYKDFFVHIYSRTIAKEILYKTDYITVLSDFQRKRLSSICPNSSHKINVIPNAIDTDLFNELDKKSSRTNYNSFNFLYVGQMIKRKGLTWLINALKVVIKSETDVKLILVGDGVDIDYYKKLVEELDLNNHVEFLGRINNKSELVKIYKNADVFVLPSLSEGLPTVILEAFYFGLPVISTNLEGIKEYFGNYAFLVPPRDSLSLAGAMIYLCKDDHLEEAKKLSKKFINLIETKYSWNVVVAKYENAYNKILSNDNDK